MQLSRQSPLIRHHEFVYVILAHGRGEGLSRLVSTLRKGSPDSAIVIHFDRKGEPPSDLPTLVPEGLYFVEPRIDVVWGGYSLLEAVLTSLRFVAKKIEFSWLSLISGNDYPAEPLHQIESELRQTHFDAFVRSEPVSKSNYETRYYFQYAILPRFRYAYLLPGRFRRVLSAFRHRLNESQQWLRIEGGVRGISNCIGLRTNSNPFSESFVCHKGSTWFAMSSKAIEYLLTFERTRPDVLAWYRRTWVPDESYYQTVIKIQ